MAVNSGVSVADREQMLDDEVDRQLAAVRTGTDALAARSGTLFGVTALAASLLVTQLDAGSAVSDASRAALSWAAVILGAATVFGVATLRDWGVGGPDPDALTAWYSTGTSGSVAGALFLSKVLALKTDRRRMSRIKMTFYLQAGATLVGTALALLAVGGAL